MHAHESMMTMIYIYAIIQKMKHKNKNKNKNYKKLNFHIWWKTFGWYLSLPYRLKSPNSRHPDQSIHVLLSALGFNLSIARSHAIDFLHMDIHDLEPHVVDLKQHILFSLSSVYLIAFFNFLFLQFFILNPLLVEIHKNCTILTSIS